MWWGECCKEGEQGLSWDLGSLHGAPGARQNHMFPISCSGLLVQGVLAEGDLFWLQTPVETTQEREREKGGWWQRKGERKREGEVECQREEICQVVILKSSLKWLDPVNGS